MESVLLKIYKVQKKKKKCKQKLLNTPVPGSFNLYFIVFYTVNFNNILTISTNVDRVFTNTEPNPRNWCLLTQRCYRWKIKYLVLKVTLHLNVKTYALFLRPMIFLEKLQVCSLWTLSRLWGSRWAVSKFETPARPRLTFRILSCWEASVTLYLWFQF